MRIADEYDGGEPVAEFLGCIFEWFIYPLFPILFYFQKNLGSNFDDYILIFFVFNLLINFVLSIWLVNKIIKLLGAFISYFSNMVSSN